MQVPTGLVREIADCWIIDDARKPGTALETAPVKITKKRLKEVGKRGLGAMLETVHNVTAALASPSHIFQGIRGAEDDSPRHDGWHCYTHSPSFSFMPDGERVGPRDGEVFLVFLNYDRTAYSWRWAKVAPGDSSKPINYEERFGEEVSPS